MALSNDTIAVRLTDFFKSRQCIAADVDLLQPAEYYLDTAGEDFRRMMFLTTDQSGKSLCLRPEFTVPVCLRHISLGSIPVRYGYCGTVFRQRKKAAHEFVQAGIEDLGNENRAEADVAAVIDAVAAMHAVDIKNMDIVIGDQAVFTALLLGLGLPKAWREKLGRDFGDPEKLRQSLNSLTNQTDSPYLGLPDDLVEHISSDDTDAVTLWITDNMTRSGLPLTGGRTAAEIAGRLMDKVELASVKLAIEKKNALEEFLAIDTAIGETPEILSEFESRHSISFGPSLENLKTRFIALGINEMPGTNIRYQAAFGRRLDYYTGLVFEIYYRSQSGAKPLVGGGRYDRLMTMLGAETTIPAVGFSIWLDRVEEVLQQS